MKGDPFDLKSLSPMLLTESKPFDSVDHIFELKMDGIRALAYLDASCTELRNKRNNRLNEVYPELSQLHRLGKKKCILDGEIIVLREGKPDFFAVQRRCLMTNSMRIAMAAKQLPARFVAFDILYESDHDLLSYSLMSRKDCLQTDVDEGEALALSRYVEQQGIDFFNLAAEQQLEGVVAKRKTSIYRPGKRSPDWVKFKVKKEEEFLICGLTLGSGGRINTLQICAQQDDLYINQGSVDFRITGEIQRRILDVCQMNLSPCPLSPSADIPYVLWMKPELTCLVQFMERTGSGMLRQPVFKGLVE